MRRFCASCVYMENVLQTFLKSVWRSLLWKFSTQNLAPFLTTALYSAVYKSSEKKNLSVRRRQYLITSDPNVRESTLQLFKFFLKRLEGCVLIGSPFRKSPVKFFLEINQATLDERCFFKASHLLWGITGQPLSPLPPLEVFFANQTFCDRRSTSTVHCVSSGYLLVIPQPWTPQGEQDTSDCQVDTLKTSVQTAFCLPFLHFYVALLCGCFLHTKKFLAKFLIRALKREPEAQYERELVIIKWHPSREMRNLGKPEMNTFGESRRSCENQQIKLIEKRTAVKTLKNIHDRVKQRDENCCTTWYILCMSPCISKHPQFIF